MRPSKDTSSGQCKDTEGAVLAERVPEKPKKLEKITPDAKI